LAAQLPPEADVWRTFAQKLEVGSRVKIQLRGGRRLSATLIQADPDVLLIQPRTRITSPVQRIAYGEIMSLERDEARGIGAGKAVALGVASGVGAFLGTLLILSAALD
jgi:hypothetical protein